MTVLPQLAALPSAHRSSRRLASRKPSPGVLARRRLLSTRYSCGSAGTPAFGFPATAADPFLDASAAERSPVPPESHFSVTPPPAALGLPRGLTY